MTDVTAVGILAQYLPWSVYRKIATPVLRHWFAMTTFSVIPRQCALLRAKSRLRRLRSVHACGRSGSLLTWRGEAALPSLVGKVAHAKRVTDELSSRFRKQLCPDEQKNHRMLGRILQRKRCVIWTRRDSPVSLRFGSPCREAKALRAAKP